MFLGIQDTQDTSFLQLCCVGFLFNTKFLKFVFCTRTSKSLNDHLPQIIIDYLPTVINIRLKPATVMTLSRSHIAQIEGATADIDMLKHNWTELALLSTYTQYGLG